MTSVDQAWQAILSSARPVATVRLPLDRALGRILRTAARADLDSPPFDASAMDGYALRHADLAAPLRMIGTSQVGEAFAGTVGPGECVRILTGAPVPAGADCVVKQEDTARDADNVRITNIRPAGSFIRRRGENRRAGELVVAAGTRLGPPELAALASAGIAQPEVAAAPRFAHLVTGNELVPPDRTPNGAQIRDSNSTLIGALLAAHGAEPAGCAHAGDDLPAATAAVAAFPAHDVLLISGGAGAGDLDLARPLLQALGYTVHVEAVNLRPGKPLVFASRGEKLAFVLPGNPVSHWVVFQLFLTRLITFLQTGVPAELPRLSGRFAGGKLPAPDARPTFWPAHATLVRGTYEIAPLPVVSSGDSSGLVGANALLPLPPPPGSLLAGQTVDFIPCS
jgi:molybdopterin molybdotransferase